MKLTKKIIEAARPGESDIKLWDDAPRGLCFCIKPSGKRYYFVQYRSPLTFKKRRMKIGDANVLTLDQVRARAKLELAKVERKIDPLTERDSARSKAAGRISVTDFCADYMKDAHAGIVRYRGRAKKSSTLAIDQGRIDRHITPLLGKKDIREITRKDCERMLSDVRRGKTATTVKTKARGLARVTGGETAANRTLDLLGSIMSYVVKLDLRTDNPVSGIDRFRVDGRKRVLSPDEIRAFGRALDDLEAEGANRTILRAYKVVALTGCRPSEILGLRVDEIDRHNHVLRWRDTKTGPQVRPIGQAALDHLLNVEGEWAFPSNRGDGPVKDKRLFRKAVERAELTDVVPTTFRHTLVSIAQQELNFSEAVAGALVGHQSRSITGHYTHVVDRLLIQAADTVSLRMAAYLSGEKAAGQVVPFGQAGAGNG